MPSILDFGAKLGDADSTNAFNTAGWVAAITGERLVTVPPGKWRITGLNWGADMSLVAAGSELTTIEQFKAPGAPYIGAIRIVGKGRVEGFNLTHATPPATRGGYNLPGVYGIRVGGYPSAGGNVFKDGVTFKDIKVKNMPGQGVVSYYAKNTVMDDVHVDGASDGIAVENGLGNATANNISAINCADDCFILKTATDNGAGIASNANISNIYVSNGDAEGIEISGFQYVNLVNAIIGPIAQHSLGIYGDWAFPNLLQPRCVTFDNVQINHVGEWFGADPAKYLYTARKPEAQPVVCRVDGVYGTANVYDSPGYPEKIVLNGKAIPGL